MKLHMTGCKISLSNKDFHSFSHGAKKRMKIFIILPMQVFSSAGSMFQCLTALNKKADCAKANSSLPQWDVYV